MKAEHLNSFIQGTQQILTTITGENTSLGKLFVKQPPFTGDDISVVIGIVGELSGDVIYTMNTQSGFYLASKLMMGMEMNELNELSKSAIAELTNMISGNVASVLFGNGLTVDISTPTLMIKEELTAYNFSCPAPKAVCMPLVFENGTTFEIDVLLTE